jgi:hypothetical protein
MSASLPAPQFKSRHFQQADPFDRPWQVEFRWLQTGISIRHADTVDVKFALHGEDGAVEEKVIAMPHPLLLKLAHAVKHDLNDAWCMRLAAAHLRKMIRTWEDMDKDLVTLTAPELEESAAQVKKLEAQLA